MPVEDNPRLKYPCRVHMNIHVEISIHLRITGGIISIKFTKVDIDLQYSAVFFYFFPY